MSKYNLLPDSSEENYYFLKILPVFEDIRLTTEEL